MYSFAQSHHARNKAISHALLIGLVALSIGNIVFGLADHGILNGNESLYIESAREMLRTGNWAIPTLNGLPYLEKPPLVDWLLLIAFQIGGVTELAARSVSLLASVVTALALARFSWLLGIGGAPWKAAYIFLTSLGVVAMSSVAMPDALLNGLFGISCLSFAAALRTAHKDFTRWSALFLGLASLTKGFLPLVLFVLILVAYVAVKRANLKLVLDLWRDPLACLLLAAPLLIWIVVADASLPGAAHRFVIDEHVLRFLGLREPNDYYTGSIFYYVPRLFLFAFPWAGVLIFGWAAKRRERNDEYQDTRHFLWACVWVPFVFFSLSQAKANYYVILCLPPLALLAADYLQVLLRKKKTGWMMLSVAVPTLILLAIGALRAWAVATGRAPRLLEHPDGSFAITRAAEVVLCLALLALVQLGWRRAAVLGVGILIVPITFQLHHLLITADPQISARDMANHIKSEYRDASVFLYQDFEAYGALPIYLDRNIPVIDSHSNDLYFGRKLQPDHPSLVSEHTALGTERALIVVLADRENSFHQSSLGGLTTAVYRSGKAKLYQLVP